MKWTISVLLKISKGWGTTLIIEHHPLLIVLNSIDCRDKRATNIFHVIDARASYHLLLVRPRFIHTSLFPPCITSTWRPFWRSILTPLTIPFNKMKPMFQSVLWRTIWGWRDNLNSTSRHASTDMRGRQDAKIKAWRVYVPSVWPPQPSKRQKSDEKTDQQKSSSHEKDPS